MDRLIAVFLAAAAALVLAVAPVHPDTAVPSVAGGDGVAVRPAAAAPAVAGYSDPPPGSGRRWS